MVCWSFALSSFSLQSFGQIENGLQVCNQVMNVERNVGLIKEEMREMKQMLQRTNTDLQRMTHEDAGASANAANLVCPIDYTRVLHSHTNT